MIRKTFVKPPKTLSIVVNCSDLDLHDFVSTNFKTREAHILRPTFKAFWSRLSLDKLCWSPIAIGAVLLQPWLQLLRYITMRMCSETSTYPPWRTAESHLLAVRASFWRHCFYNVNYVSIGVLYHNRLCTVGHSVNSRKLVFSCPVINALFLEHFKESIYRSYHKT